MQLGRELDSMERVMVIIDGGYLNGLRRAHGTMVDMTMLKRYIQNTFGDIVATHWLTSTSYNDRHLLEPFMKWISYYPWITLHEHTRKSKRCSDCGTITEVERGVDVSIATLALVSAYENTYDVLVLINGDGDLLSAMQVVRGLGKHLIILSEGMSTASVMKEVCSIHIELESIRNMVLM